MAQFALLFSGYDSDEIEINTVLNRSVKTKFELFSNERKEITAPIFT